MQVGRWPMLKETSLIQVMVSSPVRVCPGLHFTSTSVPTITGKVVVVIMSDAATGSSVHVSEDVDQSVDKIIPGGPELTSEYCSVPTCIRVYYGTLGDEVILVHP